ncbi:hypothetical protein MSAN_00008200 [Mycena sanguinolenta]|uniref:O-fucosyltransferase family protein n=1 Tax=Mycena sanguinolenta TaxID=230812 RepID=A0A8H6ZGN6_9AGAR|nr:hypothetical protein MSAN_00008200 [Mycena sanguinolenta]
MAALVVILALACLASFGFAYYLLTTRWDPTMPHKLHTSADENAQVVPFDSFHGSPRQYLPSEKFLSYLPHSGLHNQRIALENAIILGALTNRTVLVPPIRLGSKPLRYVNSESLRHDLAISGKTGLRHCSRIRSHFLPPECFDYFDYTHISPAWLFNLTVIAASSPLIFLDDLSSGSMPHLPVFDIFTLRDSAPYQYRFVDTPHNSSSKYTESIYIPDLARHPHRLLEIGTLFGSSRLRLRDKSNKMLRTRVRECMDFSSPQLVDIAGAIGKAIGVPYLGAHIRLGDGRFRANGKLIVRQVWWKLVHDILHFNASEALRLEQTFQLPLPTSSIEPFTNPPLMNDSRPRLPLIDFSASNLRCRGRRHASSHLAVLNSPLFISTDMKNAARDPLFSGFLRTFPCAFFLSDFPAHLQRLENLQNGYDGTALMPFLPPLLDAMVVGRAWVVAGTDGSTFSQFVQDVLWTKHHGLDIVERG